MKRIFVIEYPDDFGEMWMNEDNLMLCLNAYCKEVELSVEDITDEVNLSVASTTSNH